MHAATSSGSSGAGEGRRGGGVVRHRSVATTGVVGRDRRVSLTLNNPIHPALDGGADDDVAARRDAQGGRQEAAACVVLSRKRPLCMTDSEFASNGGKGGRCDSRDGGEGGGANLLDSDGNCEKRLPPGGEEVARSASNVAMGSDGADGATAEEEESPGSTVRASGPPAKRVKTEGGAVEGGRDSSRQRQIDRDDDDDDDDNQSEEDGGDDPGGDSRGNERVEIPTIETYVPRPPSYEKANAIPFHATCARLEKLWNARFSKRKVSKDERLAYLLSPDLFKYLDGGSPYPYLRLILADHDSSRAHTGLKESRVASAWASAMNLARGSDHYKQLVNYRNGNVVKNPNSVGDLSCVVMDVAKERCPGKGSKLTVGEVNEWLDVLVDVVKDRFGMATSAGGGAGDDGKGGGATAIEKSSWRRGLERAIGCGSSGDAGTTRKNDRYATLVEKLIDRNLSPVEHKFVVRFLLQHVHIGINLRDVLGYMNPHAMEIHNAFNNLNDTCTRLCDPEYCRLLKATMERNAREVMENSRNLWMTPSTLPAVLQKTISPMLSRRTGFDTFLKEVAYRHAQLDGALPRESTAKSCLAIRHPAFLCDIKMDGERDLIHVKRGIVTVQTRNGTWYSPLYSPAIGPAIRAAIASYDVDVILDGEMIAWDDSEGKPIPFGSNRAAAEMQRNRRARDGTLDKRDLGLHANETDVNVMTLAKHKSLRGLDGAGGRAASQSDATGGAPSSDDHWLQYVVFDILYVDGPGAADLLSRSSRLFANDERSRTRTGSLINMDLMQRKSVLYNLIRPQENMVEHIRSVVVRCDGSTVDAADYFLGRCELEYGRTPCELDSVYLAMCDGSGTTKFDSQRMGGRSHEEIEVERALALEQLYSSIVDVGGQEGLMFKDLASPYYLGKKSRSMGYWWKLKPDYDESGRASDIDLLVVGGRYADGFDRRGLIGSILVACLGDSAGDMSGDNAKFMAVTKINFNKHTEKILLDETGYRRSDENGDLQLGKWFVSEDVPDFMSSKSYQRGLMGDNDGWKADKKDRPDIWIRPEDSFVVTINSGEFQTSSSMQAGFTLRFPRVSRYRGKTSDDPKKHDEVENWRQLKQLFDEQEESREEEVSFGSQSQQRNSRFLTAKQHQSRSKERAARKPRGQTKEVKQFHIPEAGAPLSSALVGFRFCVQPGNYCLENDAYAAAEAAEKEWATLSEVKSVKVQKDVIRFIQSHGGVCELAPHQRTDFVLGGMESDASVSNLRILMANTDVTSTTKKDADARRLIEMGGVLKWTFVYSIVSKFLKRLDDDASGYERTIKKDWPGLADPRHSDFLVMSDAAKTILEATEDRYGLRIDEIATPLDFERALDEVGRQRKFAKRGAGGSETVLKWQDYAINNFEEHERWIFGGKLQKLWPYGEHEEANGGSLCILYPDMFADLGVEDKEDADNVLPLQAQARWRDAMKSRGLGKICSSLPLAKALGAIVSPHLHNGVTHVLCDLKRHTILEWTPMRPLSIFADEELGSRLHERLVSLEELAALNGEDEKSVFLVSPDWLEEKFDGK